MATIADELNAISVEHGYTGAAPKTIAGAIDALADTLAGTDVEERRTIAGAVKALAPYIGSGGGGTTLGYPQSVPNYKNGVPSTSDNIEEYAVFDGYDLYVGQSKACSGCHEIESIASGITVKTWFSQVNGGYVVMYQVNPSTGTNTITDITPFEDYSFADGRLSFTMPALPTIEETDGKLCQLVFDAE